MKLAISSIEETKARALYVGKAPVGTFIDNGLGEFSLLSIMDALLSIKNFHEFALLNNLLYSLHLQDLTLQEVSKKFNKKKDFDELIAFLSKKTKILIQLSNSHNIVW
jgi:hypothetical protein